MFTAEVFPSCLGGYSVRFAAVNGSRALFSFGGAVSPQDAITKCKTTKRFKAAYSDYVFCKEMPTSLNNRTAATITDEIQPY